MYPSSAYPSAETPTVILLWVLAYLASFSFGTKFSTLLCYPCSSHEHYLQRSGSRFEKNPFDFPYLAKLTIGLCSLGETEMKPASIC
uniref:Uncharacterized protein n=1 Tax=Physcomitrium patens TaxID=3218 RepID=A0A2K1JHH5_PHYPA|nr:hypothetical protein PHYPA_018401 [Physcomitrium patens]